MRPFVWYRGNWQSAFRKLNAPETDEETINKHFSRVGIILRNYRDGIEFTLLHIFRNPNFYELNRVRFTENRLEKRTRNKTHYKVVLISSN